jgi:hypothetical protein
MLKKLFVGLTTVWAVMGLMAPFTALSFVTQEGDKTYIVDQTGERWDVTQAKLIGFRPERFQYGIGRNALFLEVFASSVLMMALMHRPIP